MIRGGKRRNEEQQQQHQWLWRQKLATAYEIIIDAPRRLQLQALRFLASPRLTSPDQTDMHPSNSRDAHQRLNEEKRIKNRCRRRNISRTYDAQTRKKINKYAVAAITVLPSAMFPSIRMKSPYNNNTSRQQPKLNILFLSLSLSLCFTFHFIRSILSQRFFACCFLSRFLLLWLRAKRTDRFQSLV